MQLMAHGETGSLLVTGVETGGSGDRFYTLSITVAGAIQVRSLPRTFRGSLCLHAVPSQVGWAPGGVIVPAGEDLSCRPDSCVFDGSTIYFKGSKHPVSGPLAGPWTEGEIIGCHISGGKFVFTRNGQDVGVNLSMGSHTHMVPAMSLVQRTDLSEKVGTTAAFAYHMLTSGPVWLHSAVLRACTRQFSRASSAVTCTISAPVHALGTR